MTNIFRKAKRIVKEKRIKLIGTSDTSWYFEIYDGHSIWYNVTIRDLDGIQILPCSCRFGVMKGIKGKFCSHQISALLYLLSSIKD